MPPKTPKPYIKSSKKLEFHIAENRGNDVQQILNDLGKFLNSLGISKLPKKKNRKNESMEIEQRGMDATVNQQIGELASIGLNSLFRLVEKRSELKAESREEFVVLMDSNLVGSTAIKHLIGLYALSSFVPFYIVPNLSSTISKAINFKKCSAITLHKRNETANIICQVRDVLKAIEYERKRPTNIVFKPPTLDRPIGKSGKKRLKRKKKRQLKQLL